MSDPRKVVEELYVVLARDESGKEWLVGLPCLLGHESVFVTAAAEHVENIVAELCGRQNPVPAMLRVVKFAGRVDMQIIENQP